MESDMSTKRKMPKKASDLLDMYYLDIRCGLLEAAALFDRLERCEDGREVMDHDPRIAKLKSACDLIRNATDDNRAQAFLNLFSDNS